MACINFVVESYVQKSRQRYNSFLSCSILIEAILIPNILETHDQSSILKNSVIAVPNGLFLILKLNKYKTLLILSIIFIAGSSNFERANNNLKLLFFYKIPCPLKIVCLKLEGKLFLLSNYTFYFIHL